MAIAFVASRDTFNTKANAATPVTRTVASITAGNHVVVMVGEIIDATGLGKATSVTDNGGNTYTEVAFLSQASFTGVQIFVAPVGTPPTTVSVAFADGTIPSTLATSIGEFSGIASTSFTRGTTYDFASGSSAIPTVTTGATQLPVAGDLVIGAVSTLGPSGDTFTQDTDTTNGSWATTLVRSGTLGGSQTSNVVVAAGTKIVTAGGAQTFNPAITSRAWKTLLVSLVPAVIVPAPVRGHLYGQAVGRAATFMRRRSGIAVPRLWTPAGAAA